MNVNELRRAHQARPFRPFWLHLADVRKLRVAHPENMMVIAEERTVVVAVPRTGFEFIKLQLLTAIEYRKKRAGA